MNIRFQEVKIFDYIRTKFSLQEKKKKLSNLCCDKIYIPIFFSLQYKSNDCGIAI